MARKWLHRHWHPCPIHLLPGKVLSVQKWYHQSITGQCHSRAKSFSGTTTEALVHHQRRCHNSVPHIMGFFSANIAVYIVIPNWTPWFMNLQYFSFISMPSVYKEDSIYARENKNLQSSSLLCSSCLGWLVPPFQTTFADRNPWWYMAGCTRVPWKPVQRDAFTVLQRTVSQC